MCVWHVMRWAGGLACLAQRVVLCRRAVESCSSAAAINWRRISRLCSFSSFLLHTYLVPNFPAHELGDSVGRACIAHRGVILAPLSFGAMGGAIFDDHLVFIVRAALSAAMKKTLVEALARRATLRFVGSGFCAGIGEVSPGGSCLQRLPARGMRRCRADEKPTSDA